MSQDSRLRIHDEIKEDRADAATAHGGDERDNEGAAKNWFSINVLLAKQPVLGWLKRE